MSKPKVIAFYLPQYHPIKENDMWWGKGYTEWTNVAKAKPLFKGHKQPKIPADLGFYDLRLPEVRDAQAELAKMAGIYGFCYWHYWFNGHRLMNRPFDEVVSSGKPNFPFCLAWANHSWYSKDWKAGDKMVLVKSKLLIEQTYGGEEDYIKHFYCLLPAFKDNRYIKINGKLLFMIYDATNFCDFEKFSKIWNNLAVKEGLPNFYFITHAYSIAQFNKIDDYLKEGYDGVNVSLHRMPFKSEHPKKENFFERQIISRLKSHIKVKPEIVRYKEAIKVMDSPIFNSSKIFPTIIPNWDHTPRSGRFGRVFQDCTPSLFERHVRDILKRVENKDPETNIIFLKSWNEWGEGNYLEPDMEFKLDFIKALRRALDD